MQLDLFPDLKVTRTRASKECAWCPKVNGERRFGGAYLLSDRAAADRAAARKKIVRTFGKEELELLNQLNQAR